MFGCSCMYTGYSTDKVGIFIFIMPISSPNPMFEPLLESSHRDDPNKCSNIGLREEIIQVESIDVISGPLLNNYLVYCCYV